MKVLILCSFIMFFLSCNGQSLKKNDLAIRGLHGSVKILITPTEEDYNWDCNYDSINFNRQGYIVSNYSHTESYGKNGTNRFVYRIATYYYNAQNDLLKIIHYNPLSKRVSQIDSCAYDNKKITVIYTIQRGISYEAIKKKDTLIYSNKSFDTIINKDTLIYSNKGNLIEKSTIVNKPNSDKFVYKYNESGNLVEMNKFIGNDFLFAKYNYFYANNGNLYKRIDYNGLYHTENYTYEFDAKKNWIKKLVGYSKTIKRKIYYY